MPFLLNFTDAAMTAEFKFTVQTCLLADPLVAAVIEDLHTLRSKVDLDWLKFEREADTIYDYEFNHKDGRRWRQKINFAVGIAADPGLSFDTKGDFWRRSEFTHHRDLRDSIVALHNWRELESIEVTFA